MSDEKKPADPFSSINMEDFKKKKEPDAPVNKSIVKDAAAENNFHSRQTPKVKPRHIAKSFSLFPEENEIIQTSIRSAISDSDSVIATGSDIVRAALHAFKTLPEKEKVKLIKQHRGRGR